jgi:hypothetical protein
MFIGHFGAGFAAKKINNKPSLGTMFMATQFIDLLWPIFLIFGIEKAEIRPSDNAFLNLDFTYYPFSHSLFGAIVWADLFCDQKEFEKLGSARRACRQSLDSRSFNSQTRFTIGTVERF